MHETPVLTRALSRHSRLTIAALTLFLPFALHAQTGTITGKVTDGDTKQPIADVRVTIPGTALTTLSSADGDYRLFNVRPGRTTVAAFRIGYKGTRDTVVLAAGQTLTLNF